MPKNETYQNDKTGIALNEVSPETDQVYKSLLQRCEYFMEKGNLTDAEMREFDAVTSACEAYEEVLYPMGTPEDVEVDTDPAQALQRMEQHLAASAKQALDRMQRHRNFPHGTCPASRHTAIVAEALLKKQPYPMLEEEPDHVGHSIASTVSSLWQARAKLDQLGYVQKAVGNGLRWVKK